MFNLNPVDVSFDPEQHRYMLEGKIVPSCTQVLAVYDKPFLKTWAMRQALDHIRKNWDITRPYTEDEKEGLIASAGTAHMYKSGIAKEYGTAAHEWISQYIKARLIIKKPIENIVLPNNALIHDSLKLFLEWERQNDVQWIVSEYVVASRTYKYAGTIDFIARVNGKMTLGDFKIAEVWPIYYLQTGGYQTALEEMMRPDSDPIEQRMIVSMPRVGAFEAQVVQTPYELDQFTFLGLRSVYEWEEVLKEKGLAKGVGTR